MGREERGEKKGLGPIQQGLIPKGWRVLCAHPTLGPAKELQPLWSQFKSIAVTELTLALLLGGSEALQPQEFLTPGERTTPSPVRQLPLGGQTPVWTLGQHLHGTSSLMGLCLPKTF